MNEDAPFELPPGGPVELRGRGTTFVRFVDGPVDAPTLFLLHGWTATADLNWFTAYEELGRHFRVVAMDHRGHGRGIRSWRPFHLRDCADDVAAVCDYFDIEKIIPVGYSMGGPIAQLTWKRHPELVDGLVFCATARQFHDGQRAESMLVAALPAMSFAARLTPDSLRRNLSDRLLTGRFDGSPVGQWALSELRLADGAKLVEAGASLGKFNSTPWIGRVDVPTSVVVTEYDNAVSPRRQRALAESIPGAKVFGVYGDHSVCVTNPKAFVPALRAACLDVAARIKARPAA